MSDTRSPAREKTDPETFPPRQITTVAANDDYILEILIENALVTKGQVADARTAGAEKLAA